MLFVNLLWVQGLMLGLTVNLCNQGSKLLSRERGTVLPLVRTRAVESSKELVCMMVTAGQES